MGACTVPQIFGFKKWFDARFDDLCDLHDLAYKFHTMPKVLADWFLSQAMWRRGYRLFAIATLFFHLDRWLVVLVESEAS